MQDRIFSIAVLSTTYLRPRAEFRCMVVVVVR